MLPVGVVYAVVIVILTIKPYMQATVVKKRESRCVSDSFKCRGCGL